MRAAHKAEKYAVIAVMRIGGVPSDFAAWKKGDANTTRWAKKLNDSFMLKFTSDARKKVHGEEVHDPQKNGSKDG